MRPFSFSRPGTIDDAVALAAGGDAPPPLAAAQFIAGGTNMLDYMKLGVMQPERLIDLNGIGDSDLRQIRRTGEGLRLGALVRMGDAHDDPGIRSDYPVIAEALQLAASQQIRNMATLGGNILQRTRCEYFRETSWACNKRKPGSGCDAIDGFNRQHAVLGTSDKCIATYHGDFAQALIALDASIEIAGSNGVRAIPMSDLHRLPGDNPEVETTLEPGEIIVAVNVPAGPWTRRSHYLKVRDRQSYAFALASAAIALELEGDTVREVRIALGGVATIPWRARGAEEVLKGKQIDDQCIERAAEAAFAGAMPHRHNAFKIPLGKRTLIRALQETLAMEVA